MTTGDAASAPAFSDGDDICYYFDFNDTPEETAGGTVYTPASFTVYSSCETCLGYRQARRCEDNELADVYMTLEDADDAPYFDYGDVCYYFDFDEDVTHGDPGGGLVSIDDVEVFQGCEDCYGCCRSLACCYSKTSSVTLTWSISLGPLSSMCTAVLSQSGTKSLPFLDCSFGQAHYRLVEGDTEYIVVLSGTNHWDVVIKSISGLHGCAASQNIVKGITGFSQTSLDCCDGTGGGACISTGGSGIDNSSSATASFSVEGNDCCKAGGGTLCNRGGQPDCNDGTCAEGEI